MRNSVLIIDDDEAISWSLRRAFERRGYAVHVAATAEDGLEMAGRDAPHAVIMDIRLPGMDGLTALAHLRRRDPATPIVVITAHGNLDTAVRAVADGASEYLIKPFDLQSVTDAVARLTANAVRTNASNSDDAVPDSGEIVGHSSAMQAVYKRVALAAARDCCVLITGESGTGKELVARALHRHSVRSHKPFIPVHVAGLNPNLVESELFGHVRGAYTGAAAARDGLLSLADGGVVLLDEIGDVPLSIQVKLLRALEHEEVLPVGANQPLKLDFRMVAATHRDLARLVAEGQFREDLYFRLNVFSIHLPPLRERREDIPVLAQHFLRQIAPRSLPLRDETLAFLAEQPWPGNVRELRNALEHAAIVALHAEIRPDHFPAPNPSGAAPAPDSGLSAAIRAWVKCRLDETDGGSKLYERFLNTAEPALIDEVIRRARGNRWEAGRRLGLNRATVRKKLNKHGLDQPSQRESPSP